MKKRVVAVMMAAVTAAGLLAGCGGGQGTDSGSGDAQSTEEGKVINRSNSQQPMVPPARRAGYPSVLYDNAITFPCALQRLFLTFY